MVLNIQPDLRQKQPGTEQSKQWKTEGTEEGVVRSGRQQVSFKCADLFGLGEQALAHFCASTCHKHRAIRIQVHQTRPPAKEAGDESATSSINQGQSWGSFSDLFGLGEKALPHLCAGTGD